MRLKLASRKSDLARWQAVQVARRLEQLSEKPSIEFNFKSSMGDQNLDVPLSAMGSKGVFTEDFYLDLSHGQCDLVVHSWKDLPTEPREGTEIALTLERADVRDLLLVPEVVWQEALKAKHLRVMTSSPRRVYNLISLLPELLPGHLEIEFINVRGNVPTRLRKMHDEGCALLLAKAGLDRLLEAEAQGFLQPGVVLRPLIAECRFQVLPVSLNPPAPAQGALAVEISSSNTDLKQMCAQIMDTSAFECVQKERAILRSHGGGCHQKIGVAILPRPYGVIHSVRGFTDANETLEEWRVVNDMPWSPAGLKENIFPLEARQNSWFERHMMPLSLDLSSYPALFIARSEALPVEFTLSPERERSQMIWTAGVQTWKKLARRGVWVSGCQDGLGEAEPHHLQALMVGEINWMKLTHLEAAEADPQAIATYQLSPKSESPDLSGKTHFYWMSRTSFERAFQLFPKEITNGHNACGPGVTYEFLKRQNGLKHPVKVFIGLEQFLRESQPPGR